MRMLRNLPDVCLSVFLWHPVLWLDALAFINFGLEINFQLVSI
jgi:hypothetical protein